MRRIFFAANHGSQGSNGEATKAVGRQEKHRERSMKRKFAKAKFQEGEESQGKESQAWRKQAKAKQEGGRGGSITTHHRELQAPVASAGAAGRWQP